MKKLLALIAGAVMSLSVTGASAAPIDFSGYDVGSANVLLDTTGTLDWGTAPTTITGDDWTGFAFNGFVDAISITGLTRNPFAFEIAPAATRLTAGITSVNPAIALFDVAASQVNMASQSLEFLFEQGDKAYLALIEISSSAGDFLSGGVFSSNRFETAANFSLTELSAVPVPASLPLLLAGFGVLGFAARRKRAA